MNSGRLMIRLIDVALIILLGFIAISRLKTEYVDLPSGGENPPPVESTKQAALEIHREFFLLKDEGRPQRIPTVEDLERALARRNAHYRNQRVKLVVNIEPQKSSIIQNLVDVLDICQRNQIEKNLNYDSIQ